MPATVGKIFRGTFSLNTPKSIRAIRSSTKLKTVNSDIKKANSKVVTKGGTTRPSPTGRTGPKPHIILTKKAEVLKSMP